MYFAIGTNLKIQPHSGLVIIVGRVLIFTIDLIFVPMPFILVGF